MRTGSDSSDSETASRVSAVPAPHSGLSRRRSRAVSSKSVDSAATGVGGVEAIMEDDARLHQRVHHHHHQLDEDVKARLDRECGKCGRCGSVDGC